MEEEMGEFWEYDDTTNDIYKEIRIVCQDCYCHWYKSKREEQNDDIEPRSEFMVLEDRRVKRYEYTLFKRITEWLPVLQYYNEIQDYYFQ